MKQTPVPPNHALEPTAAPLLRSTVAGVMTRPNGPAPAGRNGRSPPPVRPAGAQNHRRTCPDKHGVPPGRARVVAVVGAWPQNRLCAPGDAVAPKGPERWLDLPRPHPLLITPICGSSAGTHFAWFPGGTLDDHNIPLVIRALHRNK